MSLLSEVSTSIRNTFIKLQGKFDGIYGSLDREIGYSVLFWFKGKQVHRDVIGVYMLPEEIKEMLYRG